MFPLDFGTSMLEPEDYDIKDYDYLFYWSEEVCDSIIIQI